MQLHFCACYIFLSHERRSPCAMNVLNHVLDLSNACSGKYNIYYQYILYLGASADNGL